MSTYDMLHKYSKEASQIVRFVYFRSLPRAEQELPPMKNKLSGLGEVGRGFYDALRGIYTAAKDRDLSSYFMKLYRHGDPDQISSLSDRFKQDAYRSTTDEYERGYLIAWEIAMKTLSDLKREYPDYPMKDEPQQPLVEKAEEQSDFDVQPRKKPKAKERDR
ncbi:MAG: hypothetical protein NO516_01755 [Candidatus Methanomethylicia archaeon]|nr:hypothetical protein [Candidatus Methanomethylicia archaeon]